MAAFVGFYWTLPVRWTGFLALPEDATQAAGTSRTVAYQRALARRYVEGEKGVLVHEVVSMEVSPDRGTAAIEGDVARAGRLCREAGATLLYVDFHKNRGWRPHPFLTEAMSALRRAGVSTAKVPADEIMLDGRPFDPADYFSTWRVRDAEERECRRRYVAERPDLVALDALGRHTPHLSVVVGCTRLRGVLQKTSSRC
ncbi:hypothetical protein MKK88_27750 [Methylobacterium sp. E-005]|uniref:hypothetical protein n=1 Tax=Methylobacterium sp. E-005 TaxID=2836549 RepID=UPI001FB8BDAE|nr:hypothetical protein [Methylobacterium sp. E-005]MCJ2089753.1 hypothetical protein [Methylobacterium sp. E-005]